MAGIIEEGDIRAFGILDEALEIAGELGRIAISDAPRIETHIGEELDHLACVIGGIGEGRDMGIFRLPDHQRHAFQSLCFLRLRRDREKQSDDEGEKGADGVLRISRRDHTAGQP